MSFFLNSFRSLRPIIGTHGSFMMFLVFLVLFWWLLFDLLMYCKYSVAMLVCFCYVYSLKMSIKKPISLWRYFSVYILFVRERKPLNAPIAICGAMFEFGFAHTFVIDVFRKILKYIHQGNWAVSFHFRIQSCIVSIDLDCSGCLRTAIIALYCQILHGYINKSLKVFGAKLRMRSYVTDMCSILRM